MTTDDQKRIRIAEFCGWRGIRNMTGYPSAEAEAHTQYDHIPDYLNSLDAIAEAEARLTAEQWDRYCELLGGSLRSCVSATARQRAEAILKIIQS